ncbi:FAD-dependent monooxygenase [Amycolatopsis sp. lyj-84]|uniref:FAD-dependent monooxygenase n=1 Tax=Amycolatopsis sp. lyj-84 TaxID=2789284 RepID=UPI00397E2EEC
MSTVLISGASIAGPALAYWLHRYGFDVTVVEKADAVRGGGNPIDVRGTALDVVRHMGILPQLREAHIHTRRLTFLDADGEKIASLRPDAVAGGVEGRDIEVRRGDLTSALYDTVRDDVEFLFNDSIDTLDQRADGVDVRFHSGIERSFDLVVGADGLHSNTRALVFGPEEQFHHYIGYCFAGFTMRNDFGLSHEGLLWNKPGRAAVLYAVGDGDELHGFLNFARPEPPFDAFRDPATQRDLVASVFAGDGWHVPLMVDTMRNADDLFFDVVSQIHLPRWSSGRVALAGDAAHAPSFLTGQGSSLALVGAYMLARELAMTADHTEAFAAYEGSIREFVRLNQALVTDGGATMFPSTAEALEQRNAALRDLSALPEDAEEPAHSALTLPEPALPAGLPAR